MNEVSEKIKPSTGDSVEIQMTYPWRTLDPETSEMLQYANSIGIETIFQRQVASAGSSINIEKRCHFGSLGICCKQCALGPCRIRQQDDTGAMNKHRNNRGLCGANADTIAARNLLMMVARGTAAHASHAKHIAQMLINIANNKTQFVLKDAGKLRYISRRVKLNDDRPVSELANDVGSLALSDILGNNDRMRFASAYCPPGKNLFDLGVVPKSVGHELLEAGHETSMGTMTDPASLVLHAVRLGLADIGSLIISSELQDAVFGAPKPVSSKIGINVLDKKKVNVVIHGHVQFLSEKIIELSEDREILEKARELGAEGINIVGCCCSGNDMLIRHGVPLAGGNLEQELIITTGIVEAFVIDVQCVYPNIENVAKKFHTKIISTMKEGMVTNAEHIAFEEENADVIARKILNIAVENFPHRGEATFLPHEGTRELMAGFSVESCLGTLSRLNPDDPLKAFTDEIVSGNINGIVLLCGCTNHRSVASHAILARELMAQNMLVVSTGCAAQACARAGLLSPDATETYAGSRLKKVLETLGKASGLDRPLPPVWHFGSCVDNSRIILMLLMIAEKLGVGIKDLPVAASAAEWVTEKAAAIGTGAVALGITVHLGTAPPILGSSEVVALATEKSENLFGGKFVVEADPVRASELIMNHVRNKRREAGMALS